MKEGFATTDGLLQCGIWKPPGDQRQRSRKKEEVFRGFTQTFTTGNAMNNGVYLYKQKTVRLQIVNISDI